MDAETKLTVAVFFYWLCIGLCWWADSGFIAMSKGSKRRPPSVPDKQVEENWQRIFGKKK